MVCHLGGFLSRVEHLVASVSGGGCWGSVEGAGVELAVDWQLWLGECEVVVIDHGLGRSRGSCSVVYSGGWGGDRCGWVLGEWCGEWSHRVLYLHRFDRGLGGWIKLKGFVLEVVTDSQL